MTETIHYIHAAIVNPTGTLLYTIGNPNRQTLIRSAAKPFQSLAIFETGAVDRYAFDDADIALMCASHSSEPQHVSRAQDMLRRIEGAEEKDLACGGHPALNRDANEAWIRKGYVPTPIVNNCSGKHVGMIAGALSLDTPIKGYENLNHPMQLRVKKIFEDMSGLKDGQQVQWAIDGCNLPAPALPLGNMAYMFAQFANSQAGTESNSREKHLHRIFHCMSKYPDMVGGAGRFCTALMEAYAGDVVGKVGADGFYGIGVRGSALSGSGLFDGEKAIGIAVKIEDGNLDMLYSAVVEILRQLGIGSEGVRKQISTLR